MVLVLLSILIVLQENFNLIVHLRSNVIAEATGNDSQDTEAERAEGYCSKPNDINLLEGCATCCDDLRCDSRDLCERAVAPSGRSARKARTASAASPAALTARGTSSAAFKVCALFVRIV